MGGSVVGVSVVVGTADVLSGTAVSVRAGGTELSAAIRAGSASGSGFPTLLNRLNNRKGMPTIRRQISRGLERIVLRLLFWRECFCFVP